MDGMDQKKSDIKKKTLNHRKRLFFPLRARNHQNPFLPFHPFPTGVLTVPHPFPNPPYPFRMTYRLRCRTSKQVNGSRDGNGSGLGRDQRQCFAVTQVDKAD